MKNRKTKNQMRCPYCGATVMLRDASFVYGKNALEEKIYVCSNYPSCDAYVGVLPHSNEPKGTLANGDLRHKRIETHRIFDEIWKKGIMSRKDAYRWMRDQLFLNAKEAHIGNFSAYMCERLMAKSQVLLDQHNKGKGGKKNEDTSECGTKKNGRRKPVSDTKSHQQTCYTQ